MDINQIYKIDQEFKEEKEKLSKKYSQSIFKKETEVAEKIKEINKKLTKLSGSSHLKKELDKSKYKKFENELKTKIEKNEDKFEKLVEKII